MLFAQLFLITAPNIEAMRFLFVLIFSVSLATYESNAAEFVSAVIVQTSDCFQCGMIEDVGQLDIKICGDKSCCFAQHLDNSETNFRPGDTDRFDGPVGLMECY